VTTMEGSYVRHLERPGMVSPFLIPASIVNMASGSIARRHGLRGPTQTPVSACASSADAVGQGYRLVRDGYASMCLAGGTEACLTSYIVSGFASIRALSRRNDAPELASRPFDADRDGFVMAEGAAVLVLEPAEAALERGAHIYAEVRGYGQTNDAFHETAPDPDAAQASRAMRLALEEAGLRPADVTYINAHGTSTPFSDSAETKAIKHAFGAHSAALAISSTKSMTGHLLGAAGALEAAVCALAIDGGWIPPTINYTVPDPECDLDYVPNTGRDLPINAAVSNSLAFGGHNVSLVFAPFTGDGSDGT
jgi:3-oxoacyl-[acyl-carrier-protein] synthase II